MNNETEKPLRDLKEFFWDTSQDVYVGKSVGRMRRWIWLLILIYTVPITIIATIVVIGTPIVLLITGALWWIGAL